MSLLQSQLAVASSSTAEVRTAASQLAVLAGDCTAATALLSCHSLKLHDMSQALLKYHSGERGSRKGKAHKQAFCISWKGGKGSVIRLACGGKRAGLVQQAMCRPGCYPQGALL